MAEQLALWPSGEAAGLEPAHDGPSPSSAAGGRGLLHVPACEHFAECWLYELEVIATVPGSGRRFALGHGATPEAAEAQARVIATYEETGR